MCTVPCDALAPTCRFTRVLEIEVRQPRFLSVCFGRKISIRSEVKCFCFCMYVFLSTVLQKCSMTSHFPETLFDIRAFPMFFY